MAVDHREVLVALTGDSLAALVEATRVTVEKRALTQTTRPYCVDFVRYAVARTLLLPKITGLDNREIGMTLTAQMVKGLIEAIDAYSGLVEINPQTERRCAEIKDYFNALLAKLPELPKQTRMRL